MSSKLFSMSLAYKDSWLDLEVSSARVKQSLSILTVELEVSVIRDAISVM